MLNEKFYEAITHEGVVSIVSWRNGDAHVVNTWHSYLNTVQDCKLLIPAAGMCKTQSNTDVNSKVKVTLGSREVMGYRSMGTGFLIEGTAKFLESGAEFDMMKEKYPFLSRVLEITVTSLTQTL